MRGVGLFAGSPRYKHVFVAGKIFSYLIMSTGIVDDKNYITCIALRNRLTDHCLTQVLLEEASIVTNQPRRRSERTN